MPSNNLSACAPKPPASRHTREESDSRPNRTGALAPLHVRRRVHQKTTKNNDSVLQDIKQLPVIRENYIESPKKLLRRATMHDFECLRTKLASCKTDERIEVGKVEFTRLSNPRKEDEEIVPLSEDAIRESMKIERLNPRNRERRWSESHLPRIPNHKMLEARSAPPRISTILTLNEEDGEESINDHIDSQKLNMIHCWLEKCNNAVSSW